MNLYLRLLWALLLIISRPRIGMQAAFAEFTQIPLLTFPNDLDLNMHVNNGRIVTLMDLSMLHLMGRAGLIRGMLKHRMRPVVGGAILRYRRSLGVFERFNAGTRLLGWDLRWFYFEHRLRRANGQDVATAIVRTCLIGQSGVFSPSDAMAKLGLGNFAAQHGTVGEMFDAAVISPA